MEDRVGRIERRGVDYIPEAERHSGPENIFWILLGGNLTFAVIVIGWLPITFGLGWWSALSSMLVGTAIGAVLLAPMVLFGPRTGTNNAVSSGAHFGVVGRIVGSCLALFSALGFAALAIWTGGEALVAGAHRLLGTPNGDVAFAVGYGLIAVIVTGIAVLGHATMLAAQKAMVPTIGVVLVVGVIVFAGDFDAGYGGGEYILGSFWPTWVLSMLAAVATVISYGPFVGDWARYISPERHKQSRSVIATGIGAFLGLGAPIVLGVYTATLFADPATPYVQGLIEISPDWYVVAIILIGLVAGSAQGTIDLYGTGLDASSLVPRLNRVQATLTISAVATTLVYLGSFVWSAIDSVSAFLTILGIVATPWMLINMVGYWWRRGHYHPDDLQVFNRGERGGRYWFTGGVNVRAMGAWVPAAVIGVLLSNTTLFTGPWANIANGIDLSFVVAGVAGAAIYLASLVLFPEDEAVFGPQGSRRRLGRASQSAVAAEPATAEEAMAS